MDQITSMSKTSDLLPIVLLLDSISEPCQITSVAVNNDVALIKFSETQLYGYMKA